MPSSLPQQTSALVDPATGRALPAAVLWDMDGTLIDTEPYWIAAETALVAESGDTWTHEDALSLVGSDLLVAARVLQERGGVRLGRAEIVERLVGSVSEAMAREMPWRPGAREVLERLRVAGVPCALVTMSYQVLAARLVAAVPEGTFAAVVTGDQVSRGKPDPEPYRVAAERLGVDASSCVAFEDSPPGLASAAAAGARVVGVQSVVPLPQRPGLSRVRTLEPVDLTMIAAVAAGDVLDLLAEA